MNRRRLAEDLADAITEAADLAAGAVWSDLRPRIEQAWRSAFAAHVVTAAIDETALRGIPAGWSPPAEMSELVVEIHRTGTLMARDSFGDAARIVPVDGPVFDAAARAYMAEATNRLAGMGDAVWNETRRVLADTLETTVGREEIKAGLERALNVSEFRADTIARTEIGAAASAGVAYTGDTLAAAGIATFKEWFASHDPRTRESHADADGQTVPMADMFVVGGYELSRPLDPLGPAEEVINCRCTMLLVDAPPGASTTPAAEREVMSPSDAMAWFRGETKTWQDAYASTPAGVARSDYIGGSHQRINAALRNGDIPDGALALDEAIAQTGIDLPTNLPLFRGARAGDLAEGTIVENPEFLSLSPIEQVSQGFAGYSDDSVLYQIVEHEGIRAVPGSSLESELIAQRDTVIEVLAVVDNPLGGRIAQVRLLGG